MAIWQFRFSLVPAEALKRIFGGTDVVVAEYVSEPGGPRYLEPDELAALPVYWDDPSVLRQVAMMVSSFLPEMKSWSERARMFGDDELDRVEVWDDHVNCRVDMRNVDFEMLNRLFSVAKRFDCKIVVHGTGLVADPDLGSLTPHVEASNAYKFCVMGAKQAIRAFANRD